MPNLRLTLLSAAFLLPAGSVLAQEGWQQPVYKCNDHTYSHAPCAAAPMGSRRVSKTYEAPVPQDRAKAMNRAQLPPEARRKCAELESSIRREEARLKSKPAPTQEELGDVAIQRVKYREMRC
ncbi:hypothetical protein EZ313_13530 [Ramlibacter henchirensis]|uniref:DUF4124 domain-containing protein n=1 Tax=Ramlibacter henchirensis TaxID=204072 RepID=A0A4Z0BWA8_9BURK|nr:hypothetical protein [Ramlibacter henchirensis]TFZ02289.1 hypothetical protein EZ313_13530 [Ramlibacter henchirensis]